jgi:hypothetical protein
VAFAVVPTVEALGVSPVEVLHARRQPLGARVDDEVVVRAHQTVRAQLPAEAADDTVEERKEVEPVFVVQEDEAFEDALGRDLEEPVREVAASSTRHSSTVAAQALARPRRRDRHTSGTPLSKGHA